MGLQAPANGVCGPAGCLPVTKGIVVISLTPFSGCGLALLNRLPTMPEHNSLCGATCVWCDGWLRGCRPSTWTGTQPSDAGSVLAPRVHRRPAVRWTSSTGYLLYPSTIPRVEPRVWRDGSLRGVRQGRLGCSLRTSATLSGPLDTGDTGRVDFRIPERGADVDSLPTHMANPWNRVHGLAR